MTMTSNLESNKVFKSLSIVVALVLLVYIFHWRAYQNFKNENAYTSNIFVFWLSGKLILEGENPYNSDDWAMGHERYGTVTPKEPTFLYPLPVAIFLIPMGILPLEQAYYAWQMVSLIIIGWVVYLLLNRWKSTAHNRLLIPIILLLLYFGPLYLTLKIGSIGPFTLLFLFGALYFLDKNNLFAAGLLLSLTMLKPPQGVMILFILGIIFLLKRQYKAIYGIVLGGVILLILGMLIDPNWVSTFIHSSEAAFDRRLGVQSNVWSFSYLACNANSTCYYLLGSIGMLTLLALTLYYLLINRQKISNWETLNLIIPVSFVATLYLWAYDQILYIIPIVWIVGTLVERTKSYILAFIFLIVLDIFSFYALIQQAGTDKDLWSLGTTIIVLSMVFLLIYLNQNRPIQTTSRQN